LIPAQAYPKKVGGGFVGELGSGFFVERMAIRDEQ
jgi:hypothetical protein